MSEVTVEVGGIEHTYETEEFLICERCDHNWIRFEDTQSEKCPECGNKKAILPAEEQITLRSKWLWDGAASVDEMVSRLNQKAKVLEELQNDGWTVNQPPTDGYARLARPIEADSRKDSTEVTLSE
jgi:anaerobic ribonucleoside-triphosphate reductase